MTTKIYGESNDTVVITGDIEGRLVNPNIDENHPGIIIFDDGTILKIWYNTEGYWCIEASNKGSKYNFTQKCCKTNDDDYTDGTMLNDGVTACYCSTNWIEFKSVDNKYESDILSK